MVSRHKLIRISLLCLIGYLLNSCNLSGDPHAEASPILLRLEGFRSWMSITYPELQGIGLRYQPVSGEKIPYPSWKKVRGVSRMFYTNTHIPSDSIAPMVSVYLLTFSNQRFARQTFDLYCRDKEIQKEKLVNPPCFLWTYKNYLVQLEASDGFTNKQWEELILALRAQLQPLEKPIALTCRIN